MPDTMRPQPPRLIADGVKFRIALETIREPLLESRGVAAFLLRSAARAAVCDLL
jgi:hypothetical protein